MSRHRPREREGGDSSGCTLTSGHGLADGGSPQSGGAHLNLIGCNLIVDGLKILSGQVLLVVYTSVHPNVVLLEHLLLHLGRGGEGGEGGREGGEGGKGGEGGRKGGRIQRDREGGRKRREK